MTPSAESVTFTANDQSVWPWQAHPYKLWSLLDMIQFSAHSVLWCGSALRNIRADCMIGAAVCIDGRAGFAPAQDLDTKARTKALWMLADVEKQFRMIGMLITADTVKELIDELNSQTRHSFEWLVTQVDS